MQGLFSFPNPVNEKAARVVAGVVLVTVIVILGTGAYWLLIPLAYGFWARVLTGPTLSPLGWIAQNVVAPRLGAKRPVPGPPKRFAQGLGAAMSTAALVLALIGGDHIGRRRRADRLPARGWARVDLRLLRRLQDLRAADARRADPRDRVPRVRRYQRPPPGTA